jgi:large subunit ribosomal protein L15
MKLHSLPSSHKRVQRVGRGGKRGTTAGRGSHGQRSRAGHRIRPAERDLILRIPKMRGYRNKPKSETTKVFNLEELAVLKSYAKAGAPLEVDIMLLKTAGLRGKQFKGEVKILANGEVAFPMLIKGIKISKSAQAKLEKTK